jgi:hypothetical protein
MPVSGNLPRADTGRRATTFQVPLCQDCRSRASRLSADQRNARVMAVLIGALVGLIAVVAVLALSIIPFAANPFVGLLILGGIWFITFSLLGGFMLARVGRLPPAPDAAFVRTTLRVAADPAGPLTAFEWRNRQTAVSFHEANAAAASAAPSVVDETASAS